nr:hypothetical protein [uncultured bacterium]
MTGFSKALGGVAIAAMAVAEEGGTHTSSFASGSVHTLIIVGVLGALGILLYSVANGPR